MSFLPKFLMRVTMVTNSSEKRCGTTSIVIRRPYAHLENELRSVFKWEEDVKVILDRRYEERRKSQQPVTLERRAAEQRRQKQDLVDVVISI